jgi:glycosyltransferase involved in cell wall biosynthesis
MEDRMHICLFSFAFSPFIGGAELQTEKLARQMQTLGHDVMVVTMRHNREWKRREVLDGLPVIRIGGLYRRNRRLHIGRLGHPFMELMAFLTLWRLRQQYDIIHVMQLSPLAVVAAFICKLTHKHIIIRIQSAGPDERQKALIKQQGIVLMGNPVPEKQTWRTRNKNMDLVGDLDNLALSIFGKDILMKFLRRSDAFYQVLSTRCHTYLSANGFRPEQIIYVPNGIDTEYFQPPSQRPDPGRPERDIICVARLEYPKGVDVLLHVWSALLLEPAAWRKHLKPRLLLVGHGTFKPQLERLAEELSIEDSVEFLGSRTDVVKLLQQAWGFIMPSRWEGMSNALLEAMACGLPCVATNVSGSEDLIVDGVNGLLVEPEQPAAMARALRHLIEDASRAQQLAQNARTTVQKDYQFRTTIERCLNTYHHLHSPGTPILPLTDEEMRKL